MSTWPFQREKFKELILFIAWRCADDADYGDTFLNKVLFFSDALAVQNLGTPITGARYQKLPYGPAPRALLPVRTELETEGLVTIELAGDRRITRANRDARNIFPSREIQLVESVIDAFRGMWAIHISDASHELSPGWNLVEMYEDIPLESQLISTGAVPEEHLQRGRELAARYGW